MVEHATYGPAVLLEDLVGVPFRTLGLLVFVDDDDDDDAQCIVYLSDDPGAEHAPAALVVPRTSVRPAALEDLKRPWVY